VGELKRKVLNDLRKSKYDIDFIGGPGSFDIFECIQCVAAGAGVTSAIEAIRFF
jgi:hypothetical protein